MTDDDLLDVLDDTEYFESLDEPYDPDPLSATHWSGHDTWEEYNGEK
jgi:hypothetical protein